MADGDARPRYALVSCAAPCDAAHVWRFEHVVTRAQPEPETTTDCDFCWSVATGLGRLYREDVDTSVAAAALLRTLRLRAKACAGGWTTTWMRATACKLPCATLGYFETMRDFRQPWVNPRVSMSAVEVYDVRSGVRVRVRPDRAAPFRVFRDVVARRLRRALGSLAPPRGFPKLVLQGPDFEVRSWRTLDELLAHADAVMAHFEPRQYAVRTGVASGLAVLQYRCVSPAFESVCGFPLLCTAREIAAKLHGGVRFHGVTGARLRVAPDALPFQAASDVHDAIYELRVQ